MMKKNPFLESIIDGMKKNFIAEGSLIPMIFIFTANNFAAMPIPVELFDDEPGKDKIRKRLISLAKAPGVQFLCVVFEASGKELKTGSTEDETFKAYLKNGGRLEDMVEKVDLICCSFSSPNENKLFAFEVNCEKQTVGDEWLPGEVILMGGLFSHLFPFQFVQQHGNKC